MRIRVLIFLAVGLRTNASMIFGSLIFTDTNQFERYTASQKSNFCKNS